MNVFHWSTGRSGASLFLALLLLVPLVAAAKPPALRDQISLNGDWPVGGAVPVYAGLAKFNEQTYEREVAVPAEWGDRVIKIEFGAVNFIALVFVNGAQVAEHVGGWMPFAVEVTRFVSPGKSFRLKVIVKGPKHPPIVDTRGVVAWPVGAWSDRGGIADDVWLRAYGQVHIQDAFIRTSWERNEIAVDYTVHNAGSTPRSITIAAGAQRESDRRRYSGLQSEVLSLAPGEVRSVTVKAPCLEPALYWPDQPDLSVLESQVLEDAAVIDRETRRFGFREITIRGNQFYWNGVRVNLFGDYQTFGDLWYVDSGKLHSPLAWPATVARMKAMNIRVLRWHHSPVPQYLLDVCDEAGLLVCDESANYARDFHLTTDKALYLKNAEATIEPWIRADRNHPSIYLWNATNEMTHDFCGPFEAGLLTRLGDLISRHDSTRPVGYDGDNGHPGAALKSNADGINFGANTIKGSALVDYHYPEGYNLEPVGSIYGWKHLVLPDRPTGSGELLHTRSPLPKAQVAVQRNMWWLGIWLRGLRYTNWTNVKPACWWFTDADLASSDPKVRQRTINLRNALAPVALFDKAYDDLGIAPYVTGTTPGGVLPELRSGETVSRTLVLYNDDFRGTEVTLEVELRRGSVVFAAGRETQEVELGAHVEVACEFQVPSIESGELELVLRTHKAGQQRFEEVRRFTLIGGPPASPGSHEIRFRP